MLNYNVPTFTNNKLDPTLSAACSTIDTFAHSKIQQQNCVMIFRCIGSQQINAPWNTLWEQNAEHYGRS